MRLAAHKSPVGVDQFRLSNHHGGHVTYPIQDAEHKFRDTCFKIALMRHELSMEVTLGMG